MGHRAGGLSPVAGRLATVGLFLVVVAVAFVALRQPVEPPGAPPGVPAGAQAAVVDSIVDGDTIWVRAEDARGSLPRRERAKIRLLEIDTPETQAPGAGVECGGREATEFARRRMPVGSTVHLVADAQDTDQYDRFLRYVWTSRGEFFNLEAVRTGHARAVLYEPNDAHIEQLRAAEAQARAAGRGIWGDYCPSG